MPYAPFARNENGELLLVAKAARNAGRTASELLQVEDEVEALAFHLAATVCLERDDARRRAEQTEMLATLLLQAQGVAVPPALTSSSGTSQLSRFAEGADMERTGQKQQTALPLQTVPQLRH